MEDPSCQACGVGVACGQQFCDDCRPADIITPWPDVDERARHKAYVLRMNAALLAAATKADLEGKPLKAFELRSLTRPTLFL